MTGAGFLFIYIFIVKLKGGTLVLLVTPVYTRLTSLGSDVFLSENPITRNMMQSATLLGCEV